MKKKITITDIANLAGVSKATVSFYLNGRSDKMSETTATRIKEAIEKTGYRPSIAARSLNSKKSHLIGVIIGDITKPFANQIVKGIEDSVNESNYLTIVASTNFDPNREKMHLESMISMGVDGFIVQPSTHFDSIWSVLQVDKPIVYFDSSSNQEVEMSVKTNNYEAVYSATKKLIKKGYEHFVLVSHNPFVLTSRFERNQGCLDALEEEKIPFDVLIVDSEKDKAKLSTILFKILDTHKNVCVFAFNNTLLQSTYEQIRKYKDRIPEVGLIGFDHADWCEYVTPSISTVSQPAYSEGLTAGNLIIDAIYEKNEIEKHQVLSSTLYDRDSTNLVIKEKP